ncbi:protein CURVATURE THYLAKOID 1B, chloroplastic isoform X2 [Malania oleifera]|uniref:protein CURVATURE THYLAKOID 1B, chloroplastic isoform X2 n=1 Tax=Malania oleifera TaxID=397392 RepID=UPI0025AE7672|nr:protein CURVATURE THYLAKOID 1B, chloroplastic isoform X2 [Malania oleifera]
MASATSLPASSSSTLVDGGKAPSRQPPAAAPPQCVTLSTLAPLPLQSQSRTGWKTTAYGRKIARNVVALATGEAPAEVAGPPELQDILKTVQEAWDKVDDKYAVTSLVVAALVAVWASSGMISAIDRLPLVPGVLELVGIGYSGGSLG